MVIPCDFGNFAGFVGEPSIGQTKANAIKSNAKQNCRIFFVPLLKERRPEC
jgi:hypothetical protein